jgi:uncharacterized protein
VEGVPVRTRRASVAVAMSRVADRRSPHTGNHSADHAIRMALSASWVVVVVAGFIFAKILSPQTFGWVVPLAALFVVRFEWDNPPAGVRWVAWKPDTRDLVVIAATFVVVTAGLRVAFSVEPNDRGGAMFLTVASALLVGVAGPVVYTVWHRHRSLASLGITSKRASQIAMLSVLFGLMQFLVTRDHQPLPTAGQWIPLMVMSAAIGLFEAVFFFGFAQGLLEESLGTLPAAFFSAGLYALSHYGYHAPVGDLIATFGFGVLFAIAYRLGRSIFILWPLLTPVANFMNNVRQGIVSMPWTSLAAFADVLLVMAVVMTVSSRPGRSPDTA